MPRDTQGNIKDGELHCSVTVEDKVIEKFKNLSELTIMDRCHYFLNTNVNESIHSRLYQFIDKTKHYSFPHIMFASEITFMIHNFGHLGASILPTLGLISEKEIRALKNQDVKMLAKAEVKN